MEKNPSQREFLQPFFTQSNISVPNPTTSIQRSRTASTVVLFLHSQSIYTLWNFMLTLKLHIQSLHLDKSIVDRKRDEGRYVYGFYILLCWSVYTFCLKLSENFNSFYFIHTIISNTYLHSNITDFPLTYHIRVSSIEFYVHRITLFISWKCFMPHNQLLHWICNISTDYHLLFTKLLSSEFQECFGKLLYHFEFIQFHAWAGLLWNLNFEKQYLVVVFSQLYLPSYLSNNFTDILVSPLLSWFLLFLNLMT